MSAWKAARGTVAQRVHWLIRRWPADPSLATASSCGTTLTSSTVVHYGDFQDPPVTAWSNVTFADNYWQAAAPANAPATTFTPDGRAIANADGNVNLKIGRAHV